jgi:hypothetical protein
MGVAAPNTVVIFDCESDGRPNGACGNTRSEQDFKFVQCTCACALVVPVAQLPSLDNATAITCWRDGNCEAGYSPFEPLLEAFDAASVIVGYNAFEFDFPLLHKHYTKKRNRRYLEHRIKCLDVFSRLRAVSNHWPRLDDLLIANELAPKSGNGCQAIRLWQADKREELEAYCMADVRRTAELSMLKQMTYGMTIMPEHVYGLMPALTAVLLAQEEGEYVVV